MTEYKRNFLKQVLVRADFISSVEAVNSGISKDIQNLAVRYFPIPEPSKQANVSGKQKLMWEFFAKDRLRKLRITEDFMVIEHNRYTIFEELQTAFNEMLGQMFVTYDGMSVHRLGLRYIDEIQLGGDPFDWSTYINKNLLSILEIPERKETVVRAFHNLEMRKEECTVRFQYGIWNPDYPSPLTKQNFVLDTDVSRTGILSVSEVRKLLPLFHDEAVKMFENSIEDGLRDVMNAG